MPSPHSVAKGEALPHHQSAGFEAQATLRFLYFIKGSPSANGSLSEEMA